MTQRSGPDLQSMLDERYADAPALDAADAACDGLASLIGRGSCRDFLERPIPTDVLNVLCAAALASPTKSDLQQRDIVLLQDPSLRSRLSEFVAGQAWVADAPMIAIFCGNNRRQRLLHDWHGIPFANDHLDAFFNATADAAIALGAFVAAAEKLGLGCCPISAVRNAAPEVSDMIRLPQHVFPFAGLAVGYPRNPPTISKRLPLVVTCHVDQYREVNLRNAVETYDTERAKAQPYPKQRFVEAFGSSLMYGWSSDKVRQYSRPERADFGAYVRAQGFNLD